VLVPVLGSPGGAISGTTGVFSVPISDFFTSSGLVPDPGDRAVGITGGGTTGCVLSPTDVGIVGTGKGVAGSLKLAGIMTGGIVGTVGTAEDGMFGGGMTDEELFPAKVSRRGSSIVVRSPPGGRTGITGMADPGGSMVTWG